MLSIRHILFPFDFSTQGVQAAPFVRALARRFNARVTLFSAGSPPWDGSTPDLVALSDHGARQAPRQLQSELDQALPTELTGVPVDRVADAGDPAYRIVDFAHTHDVDLIMMPTHGVGLFRRLLLGSVAAKVLHDARCPVWTATHAEEEHGKPHPRSVLCAVDDGEGSVGLMQWAEAFSARIGARLSLLHVVEPITDWPSLEHERARQDQFRLEARAKMESVQATAGVVAPLRVAVGDIVTAVAEDAWQEDADLVVIGRGSPSESPGRWRSHVYGISRRSPCPVLSA